MRTKASLSLSVILSVMMVLIVMVGLSVAGVNIVRGVKTDKLKAECDVIDHALETWASAHKRVVEASIHQDEEGRTYYGMERQYPETLEQLGELQVYGYIPRSIDKSGFRYATRDHATRYRLEVNLPDGSVYVSPGSGY